MRRPTVLPAASAVPATPATSDTAPSAPCANGTSSRSAATRTVAGIALAAVLPFVSAAAAGPGINSADVLTIGIPITLLGLAWPALTKETP